MEIMNYELDIILGNFVTLLHPIIIICGAMEVFD
jgi:hypothetical protein